MSIEIKWWWYFKVVRSFLFALPALLVMESRDCFVYYFVYIKLVQESRCNLSNSLNPSLFFWIHKKINVEESLQEFKESWSQTLVAHERQRKKNIWSLLKCGSPHLNVLGFEEHYSYRVSYVDVVKGS